MRDYAKVLPKMWHGKTTKDLRRRGSEALLVGLYLMTSPSSNMLGLYNQPLLYMAHETGLGIEGATKGLQQCIEAGFCSYDEDSEFVFVFEMAKYQVSEELKGSDLRCKGIQKEYDGLPSNPFLGDFYDQYVNAFHMTARRNSGGDNEGAMKPLTKPLRSQEQEQEQEQEQKSSSLRSEDSAAKTPRSPSRPKREEVTLAKFLENCKAAGAKPVPDDHPIREWCVDAKIPVEMLQVAWVVFREKYLGDEKLKGKRYKDWAGHFANAVKDRWHGLWFIGDDGNPAWTSTGLQRKQVLDAQQKPHQEAVHEPA
jgi:hypothetical protein